MSNLFNQAEQPCAQNDAPEQVVTQLLTPREADIGGVTVRRVFPTVGRKMIGPWVFFDEMGPVEFAPGPGLNVPPHPHIGLATVTYLFAGEILHRDSLGSVQAIRPGDINLMLAGSGVVHSERESQEAIQQTRHIHGLQLWLALPEAYEESAPAFHHISGRDIPALQVNEVKVRVLIGSAYGETSPVPTYSDTLYIEAFLKAGQTLALPSAEERGVYVASGAVTIANEDVEAHTMAVLANHEQVTLTASKDSRIALIGGTNLGKRHINWNFVSSSRDRISQARNDWQAGAFRKVPGDEEEFVPLPK